MPEIRARHNFLHGAQQFVDLDRSIATCGTVGICPPEKTP